MDTFNYGDKLWRKCPTKSDNNSFFHSAFGVSVEGVYYDNCVQSRRHFWAAFLSYFNCNTMPPCLSEIVRIRLFEDDGYNNEKQRFNKYLCDIVDDQPVTMEELPILATLESTTLVVFADSPDPVVIRPNRDILGPYPNVPERPLSKAVLLMRGNVFSRLSSEDEETQISDGSDEETGEAGKFNKLGTGGVKGIEYQVSLLTICLLNALRTLKKWKLSTENKQFPTLDDVVIEWPKGSVLLQSKYRESKKITKGDLLSTKLNGDFSLPKYFLWYSAIKMKYSVRSIIICTNADIYPEVSTFLNRMKVPTKSILHYESPDGNWCYTFSDDALPELEKQTIDYFDKNEKHCIERGLDRFVIQLENLKDFFKRLQFYYNYPTNKDMGTIIKKLLSYNNLRGNITPSEIYNKVHEWYKQTKGVYLTTIHAKAKFTEIFTDRYCQTLEQYNVFFQDDELNFFRQKRMLQVIAEGGYLLHAIKVYRAVQDYKKKILYIGPDVRSKIPGDIVEIFKHLHYTYLIIIYPKTENRLTIKSVYSQLNEFIRNNATEQSDKKVILVTENGTALTESGESYSEVKRDLVSLKELSTDTKTSLLNKKNIRFQGKLVSLYELLEFHVTEELETALNSDILEKLVNNEEIRVGIAPTGEDLYPYYIGRDFERTEIVIDENDIYDLNEKVVLIADSPGMGKSTILTKLSKLVKQRKSHLWVMPIKLNNYTKHLKNLQSKNCVNFEVVQLLSSKLNRLENLIFLMNNKVVLMLDGIDEISPNYTDLVINLLSHCQKASNYAKIFVTTRRHVILNLPASLQTKHLRLLPFTQDQQVDFLVRYWTHHLKLRSAEEKLKCKMYAEALIKNIQLWMKLDRENQFPAIPLQLKMLAEVFQDNELDKDEWNSCRQFLNGTNHAPKLPEMINTYELFDRFIEKKKKIFIRKGKTKGNVEAEGALAEQFKNCLAYHKTLAKVEFLGQENGRSAFSEPDSEETILRLGIVENTSGKLRFVCRTFASYFFAKYFLTEMRSDKNGDLLNEVLTDSKFKVVRIFIEGWLQINDPFNCNIFKNGRVTEDRLSLINQLESESCRNLADMLKFNDIESAELGNRIRNRNNS